MVWRFPDFSFICPDRSLKFHTFVKHILINSVLYQLKGILKQKKFTTRQKWTIFEKMSNIRKFIKSFPGIANCSLYTYKTAHKISLKSDNNFLSYQGNGEGTREKLCFEKTPFKRKKIPKSLYFGEYFLFFLMF